METTSLGLTFGEIVAACSLLGAMIYAWTNINIRVKGVEVRIDALELGRKQNAEAIHEMRKENREDHKEIMEKIEQLMTSQSNHEKSHH